MREVTKLDRKSNKRIKGTTKLGEISKKMQERRLKWYGHIMRRENECVGKRVIDVHGRRRKGRPSKNGLSYREGFIGGNWSETPTPQKSEKIMWIKNIRFPV